MTHKERLELLRQWEKQVFEVETFWKSVRLLFDCQPCSPLCNALFGTMDIYTNTVAQLIGDKDNWLNWYRFDNKMGEDAKKAKAANWKRMRKIEFIKDLCRLIEADLTIPATCPADDK